jgi:hypothetical protein
MNIVASLIRRHGLTRGWRREMHYKIQNIEPKMACVKASLAKNIVHKNGHSWDWLLDNEMPGRFLGLTFAIMILLSWIIWF